MNKAKICISMNAALLRRLDTLSSLRQQPRSKLIEQLVSNRIDDEEALTEQVTSPRNRAVLDQLVNNPGILQRVAIMIGDHMTDEDFNSLTQ